MPGYLVVQVAGAVLAAWFLQALIGVSATYGANYPTARYSAGAAFWMETLLMLGLVSVILGTASGAHNLGVIGALGVGGYIALAGLWGSPISGASMNERRSSGRGALGPSASCPCWRSCRGAGGSRGRAVVIERTAMKLRTWAGSRLLLDAGLLATEVELHDGLGAALLPTALRRRSRKESASR